MSTPTIVWHGVKEFGDACAHIDERIQAAAKAAGLEAGRELMTITKGIAPHGATGNLAESIIMRPQTVSGNPLVRVGPTIVYGRRVDLGFKGTTKRGKPRRKAVLSTEIFNMRTGKGARVGWSRRGLNPTPPRRFLEIALEGSRARIGAIYRHAFQKALTH